MRKHITYANVMATLAVVLVIGGGAAYAANTVFSTDIVDGEVKTADLASNGVRSVKIANGQVTPADLAPAEAWHRVRAGTRGIDPCADANQVAVFCSNEFSISGLVPWLNYGNGFSTAAFYKDQLGIVHLRGLIVGPIRVSGNLPLRWQIFRLPTGYRPEHQRVFASIGDDGRDMAVAQARVDIQSDGLVVAVQDCTKTLDLPCSGTGQYLSLDGISYRPDE
jgi:hypothetical protein